MEKRKYLIFFCLVLIKSVDLLCPSPKSELPCFTQSDFDNAFFFAESSYNITENILLNSFEIEGFLLHEGEAVYEHFKNLNVSEFAIQQNRFTTIAIEAIQILKKSRNYTKAELRHCLQNITASTCEQIVTSCSVEDTNYYRLDGQCNNQIHPNFGSIESPMLRLLEDGYEDGYETISTARTNVNSRVDSNTANTAKGFTNMTQQETSNDMATMGFQIMTHELMKTIKTQLFPENRGGGFDCCNDNPLLANLIDINKYCMPIAINDTDSCYRDKAKCLNYIKSFRSFDQCNIASAPSIVNFHTPFIDAELFYNELTLQHLEDNSGLFSVKNDTKMKELLVGYDSRSMQLPGLFLYLMFFARFHNILLREFKALRPTMSIEDATFETRKIVTAIYQKITIELVQSVLEYPLPSPKCYNSNINPQISIEFNIALRAMHYFIRDKMAVYDKNFFLVSSGLLKKTPNLEEQFDLLDNLTWYTNNKCGLAHGLLDNSWNLAGLGETTHCHFFAKDPTRQIGIDLRAFDFQFGREIGEPSYVTFLQTFQNLSISCDRNVTRANITSIDSGTLDKLSKRHQKKIWEIGLTSGLDFENRPHILGPGVEFFIKEQLDRSICGDRFWFNHANGIFSSRQRDIINSFDFSQLFCAVNSCNNTRVQLFPFASPGLNNRKPPCFSLSDILGSFDIRNW